MRAVRRKDRVKYINNAEKEITVAIIGDCEQDAMNRVIKRLRINGHTCMHEMMEFDKLCVPDKIHGVTRCKGGDAYDERTGKKIATAKAAATHNREFRNALKRWQVAMFRKIILVNPDTAEEAFAMCKGMLTEK